MSTQFPNPDDLLNFKLTIEPDEGMYKGGIFHFDFSISQEFPHQAPKVKCTQRIYHPNIDLEGNVCLNILREDWKPVLNLQSVVVGLQVRMAFFLCCSCVRKCMGERKEREGAMCIGGGCMHLICARYGVQMRERRNLRIRDTEVANEIS